MKNTPKISYFQNKTWNEEISRTERMFCAELFFLLKEKDNLSKFIENFNLEQCDYDVGYEVAFYRDLLKVKEFADKIESEKYFSHRAFDLALFSEKNIYIIEAKAQDDFDNEQLGYFENDKKKIPEMLKEINPEANVKIHLLALISSKYNPRPETKGKFEKIITWEKIYELYGKEIFKRADEIYSR
jgi:hypothetical protein